jgi:hypothetical protein
VTSSTSQHEHAIAAVVRSLRGARHHTVVTGPPGAGKSALLLELARRLGRAVVCVALSGRDLCLDDVCARALEAIGEPDAENPQAAFRLHASRLEEIGSGFVLLIDSLEDLPLTTARELGALAEVCGRGLQIVATASDGPGADGSLATLATIEVPVDIVPLTRRVATDERRRHKGIPEPGRTGATPTPEPDEAAKDARPAQPPEPFVEPAKDPVARSPTPTTLGEMAMPSTEEAPERTETAADREEEESQESTPMPHPRQPAEAARIPIAKAEPTPPESTAEHASRSQVPPRETATRKPPQFVARVTPLTRWVRRGILTAGVASLAAFELAQLRALDSIEQLLQERSSSEVRSESTEPVPGAATSPPVSQGEPSEGQPSKIAPGGGQGSVSYVLDTSTGRLSLRAHDVSLIDLLETISQSSGFTIEYASIDGLDRRVSASMEDVSPKQALGFLLADFQKTFFFDSVIRGKGPTHRLARVLVLAHQATPAEPGDSRTPLLLERPADVLLEALREDDLGMVKAIATALTQTSDTRELEHTVRTLLDTTEQGDFAEYRSAVEVLGQIAPEMVIAELVERMQPSETSSFEDSPQETLRRSRAALALGIVGDARALDPLMEVFRASERNVRIAAAESIQRIQLLEREREASGGG